MSSVDAKPVETKIELTERLKGEGRWPAAQRFRVQLKKDYIREGMADRDANDASWIALANAFPPLPPPEPVQREPAVPPPPPVPWKDLPSAADFDAEVRWVHQQYVLIVEETARGRVIHWERATEKPPSYGACSLALWAADNRTAFYKDVLPKAMARAEDAGTEDPEMDRAEGVRIEEMERVLKALCEGL